MHIVQRIAGHPRANATHFTMLCMATLAFVITAWVSASQAGGFGPAASLVTARTFHTATLLSSGKVLVAGGGDSIAELYDPASNTWSAAGAMATGRRFHTATLLPSGKVLVTGGEGGLASAELYDPASNSWSAAGSMLTARTRHTATLLSSGKVMVAGGENASGVSATAELYDPASNTWSAAASMGTNRGGHIATLLPSGKVLVAAGYGASGLLASAEFYDPANNTWSAAGLMAYARVSHTATLLPSGKVLVAGGSGTGQIAPGHSFSITFDSAELFDPASNTWTAASSMATGRFGHTATLLPSGQVLVVGGGGAVQGCCIRIPIAYAEFYDSASNTWGAAGSTAALHVDHTATLLPSGKVLVAGGFTAPGPSLPTASAELYDPANYTWSAAGAMTYRGGGSTATLLPSGKVLVAGGRALSGYHSIVELYDPASNTWSLAGYMATARSDHTATLLPSGKVLMAGGIGSTDFTTLASAELFDPASSTSSPAGSMAVARSSHTATLLPSGNLLVAGGSGDATAEIYEPASNTWSAAGSMTTARASHTATLLPSGKALVAGGSGTADVLATAELYDSASNAWSAVGSMIAARYGHTATLLPSGQVLVAAGLGTVGNPAGVELYDPAGNTWSAAGSMGTPRYSHSATLLPSGHVLVAGGGAAGCCVNASAELYDPAGNTWSAVGPMAIPRAGHSATLLPSGRVLVAGGGAVDGADPSRLAGAELYDPSGGGMPKAQAVEYYHMAFDHYFITANGDEITKLDTGVFVGWARTGQTFNVYSQVGSMTASACRFFSASFAPKSSHFYTPDLVECIKVKTDSNWQFEGVVFYAPRPDALGNCPAGMQPIYRLYNNGQGGAPNHRYTTSFTLRSQMLAQGWIAEGYGTVGVIMCVPL